MYCFFQEYYHCRNGLLISLAVVSISSDRGWLLPSVNTDLLKPKRKIHFDKTAAVY